VKFEKTHAIKTDGGSVIKNARIFRTVLWHKATDTVLIDLVKLLAESGDPLIEKDPRNLLTTLCISSKFRKMGLLTPFSKNRKNWLQLHRHIQLASQQYNAIKSWCSMQELWEGGYHKAAMRRAYTILNKAGPSFNQRHTAIYNMYKQSYPSSTMAKKR